MAYVGWGFQVWMPTGPDRGIADVTLDGVDQGTIDCYTPEPEDSTMLMQVQNVPLGKHLVVITATNTKNDASSNCTIVFDAIKVMR